MRSDFEIQPNWENWAAYGWKSFKSVQIEQIFATGGDIKLM